jgi:hypothetical protein
VVATHAPGGGGSRSVALATVANGTDELLTPVREDLTAIAAGRNRDESDDGEREGEADHHAEDESEHVTRVTGGGPSTQTEAPPETEL